MYTAQPIFESCALKRSSMEQDDDYDDNEESYEDTLQEENENYVCDISMMAISETTTLKNEKKLTKESEEFMVIKYNNGPKMKENEMDISLLSNEMEIDRNDEEQTVKELVEASAVNDGQLVETQNNSQMRIAFGILLRLVLPLANRVARSIKGIRDVRFLRVLNGIASSRQALTNLLAFAANTISMNLSSVQVSHRIEPILKLMKIRKSYDGFESLPDAPTSDISTLSKPSTPTITHPNGLFSPYMRNPKNPTLPNFRKATVPEQPASKCCTLKILAEPPPGEPIRADIILIHGLHGSLVNTWKQGLWENDRRPVQFQRPPKPPVRPLKRSRHLRSTRPPHKQKRARFAHLEELYRQSFDNETHDEMEDSNRNDFTYVCGEPRDIKVCDGIEYSFPTFRIRMNDDGRLLSAEIKTIINGDSSSVSSRDSNKDKDVQETESKSKPKMTPNDPNYSKCWPGDWLPLDCPGVRVIAINYTTDQYLWRPIWKKKEPRTNLIQRAREMAELLIEQKVGHGHPIIWVGHSKGGLFVKQIIVDAWESGRPVMSPFWRSARGCFFYSVPHRGSHLASIKAPLLTRSVELIDIEKNSKYLLDLHRRFAGLYHLGHLKVEVFSFVETALTLMSVLYLRIVGVDSADPGIGDVCGIRLDHREICKPRSRDCILYKELVKMIKKVT